MEGTKKLTWRDKMSVAVGHDGKVWKMPTVESVAMAMAGQTVIRNGVAMTGEQAAQAEHERLAKLKAEKAADPLYEAARRGARRGRRAVTA